MSSSEWPISTLGETVRFISGGTPKKDEPQYWGGKIPWVSSGEMTSERIYDTELRVTDEGSDNGTKLVPKNTIFVVVRGMSLAKEFRVSLAMKEMAFNQDVKAILPCENINPIFLYYYLKSQSNAIRDSASEAAHGTKKLDMPVLEQWPVPLPPSAQQEKIAATLSAYDYLIEINKRRIALLENMAGEIYREWFVRFRFPGYQATEFEKGIPKGWEIVELNKLAKECSKSAKPGQHLENRGYLPLDVMGSKQFLPLEHYSYENAQSSLVTFSKGDFIFGAMRPYQHKVNIAPFDGVTRTTCFVIKPKEDWLYSYIYLSLFRESSIDYAMSISNGSDRPYTVWNRGFEKMKIINPSKEILVQFEDRVRPMLEAIVGYYFLQRRLSRTREILLPRLISNNLSVVDMGIHFPPSMQEPPP